MITLSVIALSGFHCVYCKKENQENVYFLFLIDVVRFLRDLPLIENGILKIPTKPDANYLFGFKQVDLKSLSDMEKENSVKKRSRLGKEKKS
jgi:hypothetical protein